MELIKRRTGNNSDDYCDNKRQKTQTNETNCLPKEPISCFEDLSNELIYEIFEFLDYFQSYEALINLNQRFQGLLIHSNLPIKINLSPISKVSFKRYNRDIIAPNIDRISSLHFSDIFSYEFILTSIPKLSEFNRLKTLIIHNIESKYLETLLDQLSSLSLLSSLTITNVDTIQDTNIIYHKIFRLSALKYCKLFVLGLHSNDLSPAVANEHSSIEHLIINDRVYLHQLGNLLSYVPYLRRLSFELERGIWEKPTETCPVLLRHLTHLSCRLHIIDFGQLEQVIKDFFPVVEVWHVTIVSNAARRYLNMNSWKQLIISHMPNLRIFDIQIQIHVRTNDDQLVIENEINQFTSSFWIERQWFFEHHFYGKRYEKRCIFYSTNPYRRKHYTLYNQEDENTNLQYYESNLNSVQHVRIEDEEGAIKCTKYFPNTTKLILNDVISSMRPAIVWILNHIIPLKQLTKLVVKCDYFSFEKVIKILRCSPNIRTLELKSKGCYPKNNDFTSIRKSKGFREVSNRNIITNITFKTTVTLKQIKLLVALCPRTQYLTMGRLINDLESTVRFLLDKTNCNTRHLCVLCFLYAINWFEKVDTLIKSEALLDDYTLKMFYQELYLWW